MNRYIRTKDSPNILYILSHLKEASAQQYYLNFIQMDSEGRGINVSHELHCQE